MTRALHIQDVACVRGGRTLFGSVSLSLGAGDAALVTGPNGAGKSSLIRVMAGLLPAAAGTIAIDQASVALMAEATALDSERRLREALLFWARLDRAPDPRARVSAALAKAALEALAEVPVRLLSTGQRRRGAIARVMASGAWLWLLDEPANGLDAASVTRLEAAIARHRADGGAAVIATHQPLELPGAIEIALGRAL